MILMWLSHVFIVFPAFPDTVSLMPGHGPVGAGGAACFGVDASCNDQDTRLWKTMKDSLFDSLFKYVGIIWNQSKHSPGNKIETDSTDSAEWLRF